MDEMKRIVICKHCGRPEYYGEMRWLSGKCCCRTCYRADYEDRTGKLYEWDDLNGPVPTMKEYAIQEKQISAEEMSSLNTYYYTFGTDPAFPYCHGWVEVYASSWEEACEKFRARFPDRPGHEGTLNCAFFYTKESWELTSMAQKGNMGEFCHEVII